jgi:hypothetical protein
MLNNLNEKFITLVIVAILAYRDVIYGYYSLKVWFIRGLFLMR